ncbi:hypothetical protein KP509_09G086200 [Ceratopteris richardii]|uniref:X8 domain-containing protein n=2 Tax=Ceratopteris richardii TaxID=49495 RepID=A0A8T2U8Q8_CERRI|nr:hypothetical protein KP509_09G086200 [Ceratopteris richardii]
MDDRRGFSTCVTTYIACLLAVVVVTSPAASAFPFTYYNPFPYDGNRNGPYEGNRDDLMDPGMPTSSPPSIPTSSPPSIPTPSSPQSSAPTSAAPSPPTPKQGSQKGKGNQEVLGGSKVWCIAKPSSDEQTLMANIAYACEEGGIDCAPIQPGGPCFSPRNLIGHASVVMNMYYQKNQRNWWTCHFNNSGILVFTDPSFGDCIYQPQ